ncbi:fatty acid-2 hydroxylase 1 [Heterobasidion irregulare TC 32-1]|uniref:Ceramide very long chain fatty acid hydroxylase n=1 Tax=Heterobasidion irregulare (strain TC 32-1) TaxID=747525 RepID=W4JQW6_HETIT|nr:fatty acid-2 hydroxylase 1 [Heterobasidion irregulare TC 32-1]ETW75957.1 fatty acid-2 hydroxylase 1 [Heterobasidion irregulare TC 32-1]
MSKRIRMYTAEDVAEHANASSCWVSYKGRIFDVTRFLPDHPGGDELVLKFAGHDVEDAMRDATEHEHSESAYEVLNEFFIGRVGVGENLVSDDWVPADDFHPENTDEAKDYEKNQFLDLRKPLLKQMWEANFSKSYYLQQVHQPRHLSEPVRLFGPSYLEVFTRTKWFVIPTIWLPIATYLGLRSILQFSGPLPPLTSNPYLPLAALLSLPASAYLKTGACILIGNVVWTILEYTLHRFLFHVDYYLPDTPMFLTLHFLLHGIHHYLPMDRLRLVMPPVLFTTLSLPFTRLAHKLFPAAVANGIIAGAFFFYVIYDCMHYAMHHTKLPAYLREQKKYHLAHHYKNFELGFGVTSKVWDYVFNTVIPL